MEKVQLFVFLAIGASEKLAQVSFQCIFIITESTNGLCHQMLVYCFLKLSSQINLPVSDQKSLSLS